MRMAWAAWMVAMMGASDGAYVRSEVSNAQTPKPHCLWWSQPELEFRQNAKGNATTQGDAEFPAVSEAIGSWGRVFQTCGNMDVHEGPRTQTRSIGFVQEGTNENIVVFRSELCVGQVPNDDPCWQDETCMNGHDCWMWSKTTIGLTTVSYDVDTGRIYDADIELNGASYLFTTVDSPPCTPPNFNAGCVATDVQNTMTHELGHALGLSHIDASGSTMYARAADGETSKRAIDSGSEAFVCDAYPQGRPSRDCVIFTADDALGKPATGCSTFGGASALALGLLSAGRLFGAAKRRRMQ